VNVIRVKDVSAERISDVGTIQARLGKGEELGRGTVKQADSLSVSVEASFNCSLEFGLCRQAINLGYRR
jgi:hypothetical protein